MVIGIKTELIFKRYTRAVLNVNCTSDGCSVFSSSGMFLCLLLNCFIQGYASFRHILFAIYDTQARIQNIIIGGGSKPECRNSPLPPPLRRPSSPPCKFLVHYINHGYQNIGLLKLSKIVSSCHTFFFLNLKFFKENLGFWRGTFWGQNVIPGKKLLIWNCSILAE